MVSNMDTENNKVSTEDNLHNHIDNKSEDEILDYLMNQDTSGARNDKSKSFESLRRNIDTKYKKLKGEVDKSSSTTRRPTFSETLPHLVDIAKKVTINSSQLTLARLQLAYKLSSKISKVEFLRPVKAFAEKLNSVDVMTIDLSAEQYASIKAKFKPAITQVTNKLFEIFGITSELAYEKVASFSDFVVVNAPKYKKTVVSSVVLVGCGLMTFVSQIAIQNNNHKEDLLGSRKMASVNWNVNGHITENEKDNVRNLIASGQIKVLPKGKVSNNIQLVTSTTSISNKSLSPDDSLMMISSNSVAHSVNQGESILSISQKYKVSISDLISANPESDLINLKPGDRITVPNNMEVEKVAPRPSKVYTKIPRTLLASRSMSGMSRTSNFVSTPGSRKMLWPVPSSRAISSRYGPRWGGFHPGIDITAPTGTPVIATRDGVVISSGWSGGYGKCIIIDHGNGISTRYGHASSLLVRQGQAVRAGQAIARVGSTGWSTGPHLHYEVLINGRHNNPMRYF